MKLVKNIYVKAGERTPAPRDLNMAFKISDDNKNGLIELDEFVHLHEFIKQGKVNALGGGLIFTGPFSAMKKKKFKNDFKRHVSSTDVSAADIVDAFAEVKSKHENSEEIIDGSKLHINSGYFDGVLASTSAPTAPKKNGMVL